MRKPQRLITFLLTLALIGAASFASPPATWVKLGERHVNDRADHDTISVTGARGMFTAVKFSVSDHAVNFKKVVIHYRNGGKEEVELRANIPAGGETRVIDLNGSDRVINRIEFWYEAVTVGRAGATVKAWGRR